MIRRMEGDDVNMKTETKLNNLSCMTRGFGKNGTRITRIEGRGFTLIRIWEDWLADLGRMARGLRGLEDADLR